MEIGLLDLVMIDDGDAADTGAGEVLQHGTAEAACAHDQDRCGREPLLAAGTDFRQHHLTRVALVHDAPRVAASQALVCPIGSL